VTATYLPLLSRPDLDVASACASLTGCSLQEAAAVRVHTALLEKPAPRPQRPGVQGLTGSHLLIKHLVGLVCA